VLTAEFIMARPTATSLRIRIEIENPSTDYTESVKSVDGLLAFDLKFLNRAP
jgi:hypothetical protein